jgi:hypothetical protein
MSDKLCVCGLSNATVGSVVLHADHLAAMAEAIAFDHAKETRLARSAWAFVCPSSNDDTFARFLFGWLACAKARAKVGGER